MVKRYRVTLTKEKTFIVYAESHDKAVDKAIGHDIQQENHWIDDPYMEMESEEVP